jgi:hypothetical protein
MALDKVADDLVDALRSRDEAGSALKNASIQFHQCLFPQCWNDIKLEAVVNQIFL